VKCVRRVVWRVCEVCEGSGEEEDCKLSEESGVEGV
jgi:hypothetical protein